MYLNNTHIQIVAFYYVYNGYEEAQHCYVTVHCLFCVHVKTKLVNNT